MLPRIDILIILFTISTTQAGPLRRYVNTTSQALDAMTGVAYQPYAGSPSLSLGPVEGITALPFSQFAETPADASSASSRTIATSTVDAVLASTQSFGSDSPHHATRTSTIYVTKTSSRPTSCSTSESQKPDTTVTRTTTAYTTVPAPPQVAESHSSQAEKSGQTANDGVPTSFWTFGNPHAGVTETKTSITYTTVPAPPPIAESQSSQTVLSSQVKNTTATSATDSGPTFVYDPLTTSTDAQTTYTTQSTSASTTSTTDTSTTSNASHVDPTSTVDNPYPYPQAPDTTTSTAPPSQTSDDPESTFDFSPNSSAPLPEVVDGGASPTESQGDGAPSDTTALPGITIVPQNPSVIYITVTDPGVTTTVTA